MALRPCLDCGELANGPRCPTHRRHRDNATLHAKRARRPYSRTEQQRRAAAVATHLATRGPWCPGWLVAGHPSTDLTADHVTPVAAGGAEDGNLEVLCRSCNSRKATTVPNGP